MDPTPHLILEAAPQTLFRHLEARADRDRLRWRDADGDHRWRWRDLAAEVRAMAAFLAEQGLGPGERGAVFAANRPEWLAAGLAIQACGAALVPIYPATTVDGLTYVIDHGDVTVLFVDGAALLRRTLAATPSLPRLRAVVWLGGAAELEAALAAWDGERPTVPPLPWAAASARGASGDAAAPWQVEARLDAIDLDAPGLMLYTSGTTGRPKGVPLTHRQVGVNGCDWLRCNGPLVEDGDHDVLWLPLSHIFGWGEACLGNTLGFVSTLATPADVLERLPEVQPHVFMSVPAYWDKIAQRARAAGDDPAAVAAALRATVGERLRFCLSGGAGLDVATKEFLHRHGLLIIEGYGLTEASPTLTLNRPDRFRFDSVGLPLPSLELRLGGDGEIQARGPSIFSGYHKDPAATAATLTADGWLLTGDLGRWTDDGFLQIIGRKKEILVTSGGKNIPPANIEQRFADDPLSAQVVAYGDGKRYVVAGFWVDPALRDAVFADLPAAERPAALRRHLQARVDAINAGLESYMTIKKFEVFDEPLRVEDGMLTATLKLRRDAIAARWGAALEALYQP